MKFTTAGSNPAACTNSIMIFNKVKWLRRHGRLPYALYHNLPACNGHDIEVVGVVRWSHECLGVSLVHQTEAIKIQKFMNKKYAACKVCNGTFSFKDLTTGR